MTFFPTSEGVDPLRTGNNHRPVVWVMREGSGFGLAESQVRLQMLSFSIHTQHTDICSTRMRNQSNRCRDATEEQATLWAVADEVWEVGMSALVRGIRASQVAFVVKNPPTNSSRHKRQRFDPWVGKTPWRRAWQPTPVFLPRESHGQRGLADYSPWGHTELDTTEAP